MAPSVDTFDTAPLSEAARLRYWNAAARHVFDAIAVEPASRRFAGRLRRRRFGAVQLATVESTPVAVHGEASERLRGIYLMVNEQGQCEVAQRGRHGRLQPGELTVLCAHEPYRLLCDSAHRTHVLYVPGATLDRTLAPHIAATHRGAESALLTAFVTRLGRSDPPVPALDLHATVLQLLRLTWPGPDAAGPAPGHAGAWQARLHDHVEQHLGDPDLDVHAVAAHFGISSRYVQQLFARADTTLSRFVLERRLQWVAERLRDGDDRRIGELALACGFSDLSHFCRAFRTRFGVSARTYRTRHGR